MKLCHQCNRPGERDDKRDTYYCQCCDLWLEDQCVDTSCEYCAGRPEKPSLREGAAT